MNTWRNSPGLRPTACKILSTSPQSLVTGPLDHWTPGTGVQKDTRMVSLGDVWEAKLPSLKLRNPLFEPFQKQYRNRSCFLWILDAKLVPKSIQKSSKIHSQSHPETKHQKTTKHIEKTTQPNLENRALAYTPC